MRLKPLLAIVAATALSLPLAAHAGKFSAEAERSYTASCVKSSTDNGLSAEAAKQHCECGKKVLEKDFSDAQLKELNGQNPKPTLVEQAQTAVAMACSKKS
ncbi:hypothetical protein [Pseudomonas cremoricolorata]|uniref:Lipoprotein n=1 Tax=Pseudomonas cremoricolorata TaxID=157783 RepID=A0A089WN86_9PSED|nr:hypothetical protein [Pseudomonas cremoricolorata]AIR90735.1 hypothetical protein LK03_16290 [Pseudomonas cremoricolorata]